MIKNRELRKKSKEELNKLLKDLEMEQIKASSKWSRNLTDKKKLGLKSTAKKGENTSLLKNLRRLKAKILTILKEYEQKNMD